MPKQVRFRRGTTPQHATFTGAEGEVTFDTTKKCLVVHDGITPGGKPLTGFVLLDPGDENALQVIKSKLQISGGTEDHAFIVDRDTQLGNVGVLGTADLVGRTLVRGFCRVSYLLPYASVLTLNFNTQSSYLVTLAGNITFASSSLNSGSQVMVKILCDGVARNLTFPSGWKFLGAAAPTSIAANKTALLHLWNFGTTDADVVAFYQVEP